LKQARLECSSKAFAGHAVNTVASPLQVAVNAVLAFMGCYVAADFASFRLIDRCAAQRVQQPRLRRSLFSRLTLTML
jgi:hypothetical protein